jgi:hypothetical protein
LRIELPKRATDSVFEGLADLFLHKRLSTEAK